MLVLLVTEIAYAGPGFEERPLDDFPDAIRQIVALDGGGAYALGVTEQMQNHAVWIAADGTLQRDPIPDGVGAAYHVTPDLAWMLGTNGVAHREVDGLRVIETPIAGMPTWGRIVALSPTSALVSRAAKLGGFIAYEVDTAGNVSNALELRGLELTSLIPDGFGGAWALVTAPYDGYVGYAKYERGTWTLWRAPLDRKPLLDGFRLAERVVHDDLGVLVPDGHGGCLAVSQRALFQITPSGALIRRTVLDGFRGAAFDRELDQLQLFTWPPGGRFPSLLLRFDREGHLLARDTITVPAIAPHRPGAEWASISARDARTWIAVNSFVFRFERGVFTAFYSGPERRKDRGDHEWSVRHHEELMARNAKRSRAS
ncbi:MAG TPA: hypothetical protein VIU61_26615, partial [Kofleriaceae bacterium]